MSATNTAKHAAAAQAERTNPSASAAHQRGAHARSSTRYIASIDGLRAFAVLAVIFYHMRLGWAPGGLMGVTVFFVISGYLINGLLVAEHDRTGRIDLPQFWLRRVRRLFPAILLSVVATWAACALLNPNMLARMLPDIAPSLLFFNNWWQIFHEVSYFEAASASSPLKHFWSLAIEEQFYLVWPPLLLLLFKGKVNKRSIAVLVAILAVASAIEMGVLYDPMGDPSRAYYGTDTRAMSLLAGVFLAFAWPSLDFSKRTSEPSKAANIVMNLVGIAALGGLIAMVATTNGYSDFPYRGGVALATLLSALLIAALVVPGTIVDRVFSFKPFVWIGKISYGMYLYHYPVILLTTNYNAASATPWYIHVMQLALTIGIAALSYYVVENPIRHGAIGKWLNDAKAHKKGVGKRAAKAAIPATCFAALLAVAIVGTVNAPASTVNSIQVGQLQATAAASQSSASAASAEAPSSSAAAPASASSSAQSAETAEVDAKAFFPEIALPSTDPFAEQRYNAAGLPIYEPLLIGDSVSLGAEAEFYRVFPYGHLDSVVSRNIWESPYADYAEADQVGEYVVFCLGTNNAVVDWQIDDELLGPVPSDKKVFLVNTRSTTDWMADTNEAIAHAPERNPNVTVIDWYAASEGHDEYFAGDGTHLTEEGAAAYIELIRAAIQD